MALGSLVSESFLAESEITALGSLVSESFLAYQFLLYTKCLGGKEDWNLES